MSQKVDTDRIDRFRQDRVLLPYDDVFIAKGMNIDKSNYSSYVNGRLAITNTFLQKFYLAFGTELNEIKEANKANALSAAFNGIPELTELNRKVSLLENHYAALSESYALTAQTLVLLQKQMTALVERMEKKEII